MVRAPVRVEAQVLDHLHELAQHWPISSERPATNTKPDLFLTARDPRMSYLAPQRVILSRCCVVEW